MPYCPKCDMEFVEGVTVCTDCGGPLYESVEAAKAAMAAERAKERARELIREKAMYEEYLQSLSGENENAVYSEDAEAGDVAEAGGGNPSFAGAGDLSSADTEARDGNPSFAGAGDLSSAGTGSGDGDDSVPVSEEELRALEAEVRRRAQSILPPEPTHVYVDKSQKYDDLKSSASAFLLVGGVLLIVSVLCWAGIIQIPLAPGSRLIFQGALTLMGVFSLAVFLTTTRSAKKLAPEIADEKHRTSDTIAWFLENYTADDIDEAISGREDLSEEELSLKRFQVIQDRLVTGQDLPDQAYVDALSEEIYTKLFENT